MKKLICAKDVETVNKQGQKVFYIDDNTIVTPAAKDAAKGLGIVFSCGSPCCAEKACEPAKTAEQSAVAEIANACGGNLDSNMIYTVIKAMVDKGLLNGIFEQPAEQPAYVAETGFNGLKVVNGKSVRMDVFDTGIPENKVFYQELVSKEDSRMSSGFLSLEKSSFEWELTYDEVDYVIEGTLEITINGKKFTAHAGDVLSVPAGSKVIWGSPDKCKLFYATYPANWADLM